MKQQVSASHRKLAKQPFQKNVVKAARWQHQSKIKIATATRWHCENSMLRYRNDSW